MPSLLVGDGLVSQVSIIIGVKKVGRRRGGGGSASCGFTVQAIVHLIWWHYGLRAAMNIVIIISFQFEE